MNGWLKNVSLAYFPENIAKCSAVQRLALEKSPVYSKTPWVGNVALKFANQLDLAVKSVFLAMKRRMVYRALENLCYLSRKSFVFFVRTRSSVCGT